MGRKPAGERVLGPYFKDGVWIVVHILDDGTRTDRSYPSEAAAQAVKDEIAAEIAGRRSKAIADAIDEYEAYLRDEKGNKYKSYTETVRRLRKFFHETHICLAMLTEKRCQGYYDKLTREMASDSHRNMLAEAKTFLRWCMSKRWMAGQPLERVKGVGKRRKGKSQLGIDEARKWLEVAMKLAREDNEGAVAAMCAFLLGMRASEIVNLTVRDIDDAGQVLWIRKSKTPAGERNVFVPLEVRPFLLELAEGRDGAEMLFSYHRREWVLKWVKRICAQAGVPVVCAHSMRGLHGTLAKAMGASSALVAAAMGHTNEATTLGHYVKPEAVQVVDQLAALRVLQGGKR